ncbi:unnamed protein product [Adineta steineri]|uniref:F-box domain-containing protein n=1 Tax=Adineta steineri TaxID=433720 RepID=A0A818WJU5_9BILA|nr:unnamed protein product [Adineta steineri]
MASTTADLAAYYSRVLFIMYWSIMPILFVMGIVGAILSGIIFSHRSMRQNPGSIYFIALSVTIFMIMVSYVLLLSLRIVANVQLSSQSLAYCKLLTYSTSLCPALHRYCLVLAAIDRTLITSSNATVRKQSTHRLAYWTISGMTLIAILYYIHVLIGYDIYALSPGTIACAPSLVTTLGTNYLSKQSSVTHFEDLSNEVIYEILEFLDYFHIYQSFYNLNSRFRKFLTCSNFPIKINISSISRSNFQDYYTDIIIPYQHRITSICIRNLFFNCDISLHTILSKFIQLERLILENISSEYVENILKDIACLPNLSSLVIIVEDHVKNVNECYLGIFRLPKLKYCKISLGNYNFISDSLPYATNEFSSIEQLVIKHEVYFNAIHRLLSYVPQLRRLSLNYSYNYYDRNQPSQPIILNSLTHLFLKLNKVSFDEFEQLTKTFFCKTQILYLHVTNRQEYININDNQWKQLILSHMPFLRLFDLYIDYHIHQIGELQLKESNSTLWINRQWVFNHGSSYSTNSYRRKKYILQTTINQQIDLNYQETNLNSVRHVCLWGKVAIDNCTYRFPNATDLTLECISLEKLNNTIITLKHLIPWENLTKLEINSQSNSLEILIRVLPLTPTIVTAKIDRVVVDSKDFVAIRNRASFRLASSVNIIQNLTVEEINEVEEAKLLFILCPRLQHFTITGTKTACAAPIVRSLLSKDNENTRHLISLCVPADNSRYLGKMEELSQAKKLLYDCLVKVNYRYVFLWR